MNKLRTHERMCTPCSDCVTDMYAIVKNNCRMNTPAYTGAKDTSLVHTLLTAKMHIQLRKHARAKVQQLLRHANHCELSCNLNSVQETVRIHASTWRSRSCVDTQASSDHHPWCGPHPVCQWLALPLAAVEFILHNISFPHFRGFSPK